MSAAPDVLTFRRGRLGVVAITALALGAAALWGEVRDPAGGDPGRGEALYRQYCAVCHGATGEGDGPNAPFLEDDRPRDLTDPRYMSRLSDRELLEVILGGGAALGRSRFMPAWGHTFSAQQVADLVAYIRALSASPANVRRPAADPPEVAGARLVAELGCAGCHRVADLPSPPVAPDLDHAGAKLQRPWLEAYLRQPHRLRPAGYVPLSRSRMPDFRLSAGDSRWLSAYLTRLRPPDPSAPGAVPAPAGAEGAALFTRLACRACHMFEGRGGQAGPDLSTVAQRLQTPWVARYLLDPQAVDARSPMPRPRVTPEEGQALATYLLGGAAGAPEGATGSLDEEDAARGASLFRELACRACHRRPGEKAPERVGPDLSIVGDKLRPEWMADFLRRPHPIRPWLRARMPTFGLTDGEAAQVTAFLASLQDRGLVPLPPGLQGPPVASPGSVRAGERLASRDYLSCSSCHLGGDRPPEGPPEDLAPDLRLAARRLRPEWIVRWLLDPQRLQPGTKMPSFFADATSGPEDILDGDEARHVLALRDYLLAIGAASASPAR